MNLQSYCEKKGGTSKRGCPVLAVLSASTGYSAETLYMIATGNKKAGALMAGVIENATDGDVTRNELRPDIFGEAPAKTEAA
jgi:DNA-binding transcriptional regulator YdaS (Cro superfamily)